jgi:predicted Zn-dependent protease with MMP-like domain
MSFGPHSLRATVGGSMHQLPTSALTREEFDVLVECALASLPEEILARLQNIAVTVSDWPSRGELQRAKVGPGASLFGLYEGIPLTQRGARYGLVTPDRIILFRGPLVQLCQTYEALQKQIKQTVVHEIAHHFGIGEARVRELGY